MSGPRLTERRNDVGTTIDVGECGPNGLERGSNGPRRRVVRFFVPVIRTAFLVQRSFCIVREREEELERPPNEVGTEGAGGQKWDDFPMISNIYTQRLLYSYQHSSSLSYTIQITKDYQLLKSSYKFSDSSSSSECSKTFFSCPCNFFTLRTAFFCFFVRRRRFFLA